MELWSESFEDGGPIPAEYAFCRFDPDTHATLSTNRNPQLSWSGVPQGARSLVVICVDGDVPTKADDVNHEAREVAADLERMKFYHWVLVDLPAGIRSISAGEFADGVVAGGRPAQSGPHGSRQGLNDYTVWFAGDADMEGDYYGYDGPCPPWNDSLIHRYEFSVYALDVASVDVEETITGPQVEEAIANRTLDSATITGTYTLNPRLRVD